MFDLKGKVALISGAARGQGETEARLFAQLGAQVILADVLVAEGRQVADEIGGQALFCSLDVTSPEQWQNAVRAGEERFGHIDVLVNNAGITRVGMIESMSMEDYMEVIRVNQLGCFLGMQACVPAMRKAGRGSIINISSMSGMTGMAGVTAYVASKWAIRGMTKSAALELGSYGIRANSVHPGAIDTAMINAPEFADVDKEGMVASLPVPRLGQSIDVAQTVAFLASEASSYCSGGEYVVDGGYLAGQPVPQQDL